jgi:hypothetical protein
MKPNNDIKVQIPDKFETVLGMVNDKPNWLLRFGIFIILFFILLLTAVFYPYYLKSAGYSTMATIEPVNNSATVLKFPGNGILDSVYVANNSFVSKNQILLSYKKISDTSQTKANSVKYYLRATKPGLINYQLTLSGKTEDGAKNIVLNQLDKGVNYQGTFSMPYANALDLHPGDAVQVDTHDFTKAEKLTNGKITSISNLISPDKQVHVNFSFKMSSFQAIPFFFEKTMVNVFVSTAEE